MGIKSTFEKFTRSSTSSISNNNTFNYLQKQTETQFSDIEVLMKACESYAKIFNKKSKPPSNLKSQDNLRGAKRLPVELMSLATIQCSQAFNDNSHLKKAYIEYSDTHRRMIEKQKTFAGNLGSYIVYLGENVEEYRRFNSLKSLYSRNMKSFVSYQNKLKKQNTPVTHEQNSKLQSLYDTYSKSLHDLSERMAELTSNKKEEERLNNFTNLVNFEIDYYQEVTKNLVHLKEILEKNKSLNVENKYNEKKSVNEFVDEIMNNKLQLETFNTSSTSLNGAVVKYNKSNENENTKNYNDNDYNNNGTNSYQSNSLNSSQEYLPTYQEPSKAIMSSGNDYNQNEYDNGNHYSYIYSNNGELPGNVGYKDFISDINKDVPEPNGLNDAYGDSNGYNNFQAKDEKIDDYLLINKTEKNQDKNSIFSDMSKNTSTNNTNDNVSPVSPINPISSNPNNNTVRNSSIINKENLIIIGRDSINVTSSLGEKIYNTKELDPDKCKAIYPFKKSLDDELELEANDLIVVTKKFDDGWATGKNLSTNKEGFFPLNCLLEFYVTDKFAKYGGSKENSESYAYSSFVQK